MEKDQSNKVSILFYQNCIDLQYFLDMAANELEKVMNKYIKIVK